MITKQTFEIRGSAELDGFRTLEWLAIGHVDPIEFVNRLQHELGHLADSASVQHGYRRNVPQGREGMISVACSKGRGAYPVTVIDADLCRQIVVARGDRND